MTATYADKQAAKRARRPIVTQQRLRELFHYSPETGQLTRAVRSGRMLPGQPVGGISDGYVRVAVDGRLYMAHRLIWMLVFGIWPDGDIDHINGDRSDNRLHNLRAVTRLINQQNIRSARSHSRTGLLGVGLKEGRYRARINVKGKPVQIGTFDRPEQAHEAYLLAKRQLHEGCTI